MLRTREYRRLERLCAEFIDALSARLPGLTEGAPGRRYRRFDRAGRAFLYVHPRPRKGYLCVDLPRSWALPAQPLELVPVAGARLRLSCAQELPEAVERLAGVRSLPPFDKRPPRRAAPSLDLSASLDLELLLSAYPCSASANDEARLLQALSRRSA